MRASRFITLAATVVALSAVFASCAKDTNEPPVVPPPPGQTPTPPGPVPPPPPPSNFVTLWAAGNITECMPGNHDEATAALIQRDTSAWKVMALGDMANHGSEADFQNCYNPSWGAFKDRTFPVLGNHEYDYFELTGPPGADTVRKANGAFAYWGAALGTNGFNGRGGFYAVQYGQWNIIVVNDNWNMCNAGTSIQYNCAEGFTAGPGTNYFQWIENELMAAKAANKCTLVAMHAPRFFSSQSAGFTVRSQRKSVWEVLERAGADIVLTGQEHHYERLAPMDSDGSATATANRRLIRSFNVGTGGQSPSPAGSLVAIHPNSEFRSHAHGVLRLSLGDTGYKWAFMTDDNAPASDTGSGTCN